MNTYTLSLLIGLLSCWYPLQAQVALPELSHWRFNNTVHAVTEHSGTLYVGGDFTYMGPFTGSITRLNTTNGQVQAFPQFNGVVHCMEPDGSGGWYVGGTFTRVGTTDITRLAHILPDGTVNTNFSYAPNSTVFALRRIGSTLYVGGQFTTLTRPASTAVTRNRAAAIDLNDGSITAWNPNISPTGTNSVRTIVVTPNVVYLGGAFSLVGGQTRNRLAAVTTGTGDVRPWNPNANGTVHAMELIADSMYVVGEFTGLDPLANGVVTRNRLAVLDTAGVGNLRPERFTNNINSGLFCLLRDGNTLYFGGAHTRVVVNGDNRIRLSALNIATGQPLAFNPQIGNGEVRAIRLSGGLLYAGGNFSTIGGTAFARRRVAAFNPADGSLAPFNAGAVDGNFYVYALGTHGGSLFVGGDHWSFGGVYRVRLAAINSTTGMPTDWNPSANNSVYALHIHNNILYVGGLFTGFNLNGSPTTTTRNYLASFTLGDGNLTTFNIPPNNPVFSIISHNNVLYVGGRFTIIDGNTRNRVAAYDLTNHSLLPWTASVPNNDVLTLLASGDTLLVGGSFSGANFMGATRNRLAAVRISDNTLIDWDPAVNGTVRSLWKEHNHLFVGGEFSGTGSFLTQRRDRLALLNWPDLSLHPHDMRTNGAVMQVRIWRGKLYAVGSFTQAGPVGALVPRSNAAVFDTATTQLINWNPNIVGDVNVLHPMADGRVWTMGGFTSAGGLQNFFVTYNARYDACQLPGSVQGTLALCNPGSTNLSANITGGTGTLRYRWSPYALVNDPTAASVTVTVPATRRLTLQVYDDNGCDFFQEFDVTVSGSVTPSISGIGSAYCANAPAVTPTVQPAGGTLSGPGVAGGVFTPANVPANLHGQTLTLTYSGGGGSCPYSTTVQVVVHALPTLGGSTSPASCGTCADGSIAATASGGSGSGYQFRLGSGTPQASGNFSGLLPGDYTVTLTDGNSCETSLLYQVGQGPVGRHAAKSHDAFALYPNPASQQVTLALPQATHARVQVFHANGQQVLEHTFTGTTATLPLAQLAPGIYLVQVQGLQADSPLRATQRLVVQ